MTYDTFLTQLSKPASRALLYHDITSFERLAALTEKQVLSLHGIGPASLPTMRKALAEVQLAFHVG